MGVLTWPDSYHELILIKRKALNGHNDFPDINDANIYRSKALTLKNLFPMHYLLEPYKDIVKWVGQVLSYYFIDRKTRAWSRI